ncbi:MAG TPA: YbjN domain-containing protein [Stellaceae bacterium]|nr:YbjN domain-containing protein [Stellaceae bacterium]
MKSGVAAAAIATILALAAATPAPAKDLPKAGMTVDDVVGWLQGAGYQAKLVTDKNGRKTVTTAAEGTEFHVGFYDCKDERCGSIQFYAGFDTKGALNPKRINEWNRQKRWGRAYVDDINDPWIEMDVDLTPGGTYELLNDEFATWRSTLSGFKQFIGP